MRTSRLFVRIFLSFIFLFSSSLVQAEQLGLGRDPSLAYAYDLLDGENYYFVVWVEPSEDGSEIVGMPVDEAGASIGSKIAISTAQNTATCFFSEFADLVSNSGVNITIPLGDCPVKRDPSIAYNPQNRTFLVTWRAYRSEDASDYEIAHARLFTADPRPQAMWPEERMISEISIGYNKSTNDQYAWSRVGAPHVAARPNSEHYAVTWAAGDPFLPCQHPSGVRHVKGIRVRSIPPNFIVFPKGQSPEPEWAFIDVDPDNGNSGNSPKCLALKHILSAGQARIACNEVNDECFSTYQLDLGNDQVDTMLGGKPIRFNADGQVMGVDIHQNNTLAFVSSADDVDQGIAFGDVEAFAGHFGFVMNYNNDQLASGFIQEGENSIGILWQRQPEPFGLAANNPQRPRIAGNLGNLGVRPIGAGVGNPERYGMVYSDGGEIIFNGLEIDLGIANRTVTNVSQGMGSTENVNPDIASNFDNYMVAWQGVTAGQDNIFTNTALRPADELNILEPTDGVTFAPTRVFIRWNSIPGVSSYQVFFGEDPLATNLIGETSGTAFSVGPESRVELKPNKTYYYKVRAKDRSVSSPVQSINTDDSVVAWWRFDDDPDAFDPGIPGCDSGPVGRTVCDFSGKGNHGEPFGGVAFIPDPVFGGALGFDGVDDFVRVEDSDSLDISTEITIEVLHALQAEGVDQNRPLVTKFATADASDATGFGITYGFGTDVFFGIDEVTSNRFVSATLPNVVGQANHLVGTYNGNFGAIFHNGAVVANSSFSGGIGLNDQPLFIGRTFLFPPNNFDGMMEEVILYNRALTDVEITNSFNAFQSL